MLITLRYVVVYCSDMDRSVRFYSELLGLPVKFKSQKWTELHSGGTTLALHVVEAAQSKHGVSGDDGAGSSAPAFEVLDLDKFYEEKKSGGVQFAMAPTMQEFGKIAILLDPDGLRISVTEGR
jgi:lactoylglutathione lyase